MNFSQIRALTAAFALLLAASPTRSYLEAQQLLPDTPESATLATTTPAPSKHPLIETSVSLGVAAQLTATRVKEIGQLMNSLGSQSLDPSAGVLGSVRQSFRPWLGYSANFGYTRTTEDNAGSLSSYAPHFAIPSNVYEVSIAYMVQKHITPKLTGFADLGGGMLTFLPVHRGSSASAYIPPNTFFVPSVLFRQLGVAGAGVDYHFNSHLAIRAEYRGLLYKYPDFGGIAGRQVTVSSQPTVSITYNFGRGRKRQDVSPNSAPMATR